MPGWYEDGSEEQYQAEQKAARAKTEADAKAAEHRATRRIDTMRMTVAELDIYHALQAVEALGADVLLTDAVVLLQQAKDKVSEYVEKYVLK